MLWLYALLSVSSRRKGHGTIGRISPITAGTEGRWFPLGFEEKYREKGWYEVNDIPHPAVLGWMETVFNEGEEYEKIPRLLPYFVLPLSMALMLFRFLQAGWALWIGKIDRVVASHEVEDEIQEAHEQLRGKN